MWKQIRESARFNLRESILLMIVVGLVMYITLQQFKINDIEEKKEIYKSLSRFWLFEYRREASKRDEVEGKVLRDLFR